MTLTLLFQSFLMVLYILQISTGYPVDILNYYVDHIKFTVSTSSSLKTYRSQQIITTKF